MSPLPLKRSPKIKPASLEFTMGRKGGGKKAFLKGVVAKPDVDDATTDQGSTEAGAALPQPSTSETASEHLDTSSAGPQLPDVKSTAEDVSSESRGQLTQRHKKVSRALFYVLSNLPYLHQQ